MQELETKDERPVNNGFEERPQKPVPPPTNDIDPRQWLTHDDTLVTGFVETRAGRLKIAALSESETEQVRKMSTKPVKGNPRQTEIDLKRLRLSTIALSLNKAYGWTGTPQQISPEDIEANQKLAGEVTNLVNKITQLSGYEEEGASNDVSSFLQVK